MCWKKNGVVIVLLCAFSLWVHDLDRMGLWRDEGLTIMRARQPIYQILQNVHVISGIESPDLHPPAYFLLLAGWRQLLGESEFSYRLLSVLAMMLGTAVAARTAAIFSSMAGLCTSIILLLSPFTYWYAREARMYAVVMLIASILLLLNSKDKQNYVAWIIAAIALCSTHYASIFLISSLLGFNLLQKRERGRYLWVILIISIVLIVLFWQSVVSLLFSEFEHFMVRPFTQLLWEPLSTFMLGGYRPPVEIGWGWFIPFLIIAAIGIRTQWQWGMIVFLVVGSAWLSSWVVPNYTNPRHLTILLAIWSILMGIGLERLWQWHFAWYITGMLSIIIVTVPVLKNSITTPSTIKDDVRGAIETISEKALPNDGLIIHDALLEPLVAYYAPEIAWRTLPWWNQHDVSEIREQTWIYAEQFDHIWLLGSVGFESGVNGWLDYHWLRGEEVYFDGTGQTLLLRDYGRPQYVDQPVEPILSDNGAAIYSVTWGELVEGSGAWFDLLVNDNEQQLTTLCIELVAPKDLIGAKSCQTGLGSERPHKKRMWVDLPVGLADVDYDVQIRLGNQMTTTQVVQIWQTESHLAPLGHVDQVALLGVQWAADQFTAGQWAIGNLLMQGNGKHQDIIVELVDWRGRVLGKDIISSVNIPTNDVVARPFRIPLSFKDVGKQKIIVNGIDIGKTEIMPIPIKKTIPDEAIPLPQAIVWEESIQLIGYTLDQNNNHMAELTLYWQYNNLPAPPFSEYHVFMHVGVPGKPPYTQTSGIPNNHARPLSSWRSGEIIEDKHIFSYDQIEDIVQIGWFDPANPNLRARLSIDTTSDDDQLFELTKLSSHLNPIKKAE